MKNFIILLSGVCISAWGFYSAAKPLYLKITGESCTGTVTGLHSRSHSGQKHSRGFFKSGRRPYITFLPAAKKDSIRFLATGGGLFMDSYDTGEKVTVVYNEKDLSQYSLFSFTEISSSIFVIFFGLILISVVLKPNKKNKIHNTMSSHTSSLKSKYNQR